jgi:hypothetical protein
MSVLHELKPPSQTTDADHPLELSASQSVAAAIFWTPMVMAWGSGRDRAVRLCDADMGSIFRPEDGAFHLAASCGLDPDLREQLSRMSMDAGRATVTGRVLLEGQTVQIPDVVADPEYWFEGRERGGVRTLLGVPLLREGVPIGVFNIARTSVRPFTNKQIELATTFADQAVIARAAGRGTVTTAREQANLGRAIQDRFPDYSVISRRRAFGFAAGRSAITTPADTGEGRGIKTATPMPRATIWCRRCVATESMRSYWAAARMARAMPACASC